MRQTLRQRRGEHPRLICGARITESVFCVLVDGEQQMIREACNGDLAMGAFKWFAARNPGRTMLVFSQGNRDGATIFETIVARG